MLAWLGAFSLVFVLDLCWAVYTRAVADRRGTVASSWATLLFLVNGAATVAFVKDPWLLAPCAAGAFAGTWCGVWWGGQRA